MISKYVLGIDTSNYTTSVALIDNSFQIIEDRRKAIKVGEGMKGIRQSEALFQHMDNLPELITDILNDYNENIMAVCSSSKPRPVENSYMPVFKASVNYGRIIAASLGIPLFLTSHQEGHIEAGKMGTDLTDKDKEDQYTAFFHLSGGTTEILYKNQIIGGTKDISFGQLLDRLGVGLGYEFPAGEKLDKIACKFLKEQSCGTANSYDVIKKTALEKFKYISKDGLNINLSGIDTQLKRLIGENLKENKIHEVTASVFYLISHCLKTLTMDLKKQYNIVDVLFVGGVSSSMFLRDFLTNAFCDENINVYFGKPELSADNAVGTAIIGGKILWL